MKNEKTERELLQNLFEKDFQGYVTDVELVKEVENLQLSLLENVNVFMVPFFDYDHKLKEVVGIFWLRADRISRVYMNVRQYVDKFTGVTKQVVYFDLRMIDERGPYIFRGAKENMETMERLCGRIHENFHEIG